MTYLLDTNAISDLMRAAPAIENWMAGLDEDDRVVTCTVVRGEILFGIGKLPQGKRRSDLVRTEGTPIPRIFAMRTSAGKRGRLLRVC